MSGATQVNAAASDPNGIAHVDFPALESGFDAAGSRSAQVLPLPRDERGRRRQRHVGDVVGDLGGIVEMGEMTVREKTRSLLLPTAKSLTAPPAALANPIDDVLVNLDPAAPWVVGFPQFGHGSIKLTVLFNDPSDPE